MPPHSFPSPVLCQCSDYFLLPLAFKIFGLLVIWKLFKWYFLLIYIYNLYSMRCIYVCVLLIQHSVRLWVKFFHWEEENLSFIQGLCLQIILCLFLFFIILPFQLHSSHCPILSFCCSFWKDFQNYVEKPSAVPITKLRVSPRCAYMTSWQIKSTVHPQKLPGSLSSQKLLWNIKLTRCSSLGHC